MKRLFIIIGLIIIILPEIIFAIVKRKDIKNYE